MEVTMSWFLVLKSLLAVCIISHLSVSSVESYACIQEEPPFNKECYPNSSTCESSKGCFSQWLELGVKRHLTLSYDHRCCYTEHCNKEPIKVPALSSEPNGVECPACYSECGTCRPVLLKCTGEETMCVKATSRGTEENQDIIKIKSWAVRPRLPAT
ncbi:protein RoBo-1-like [Mus caroli]|uniref:Protein RoBo-1-like n=1 Tax=Mus caroli TaxID=10089 RepID=A0A6P7RFQ4_MUSCR|nr:protein RoBo-1-like [Mus caroli]